MLSPGARSRTGAVVALFTVLAALTGAPACGESNQRALAPAPMASIPPVDLEGLPAKSGGRLRAISWLSEEGLRVPTTRFFDTKRNEECRFGPYGASTQRCYPDAVSTNIGFELFDADCRTRVFPACLGYAFFEDPSTCGIERLSLHTLGAAIDDDPRVSPACASFLHAGPGDVYRRIGARVPDVELVRAVLSVTPMDGTRLGAEQLSAEDGSALLLGFFDQEEDAECGPFYSKADDTGYCVPTSTGFIGSYYADDACSGEGLRLMADTCPIRYGYSNNDPTFYRAGKPFGTVPPFYTLAGLGCTASQPVPGYELGEAVPLNSFEPVESSRAGEGRLQAYFTESAAGAIVHPNGADPAILWDVELDLNCRIRSASDGEYRCLPSLEGTYTPGVFADARCEVPLAARIVPNADEPNWLVLTPKALDLDCPPPSSSAVYELAEEPFTGTVYSPSEDEDGNPTCHAYLGDFPTALFETTGEVPPSRFVRFQKQLE